MERVKTGNWTDFRRLPACIEVDFHRDGPRETSFWDAMAEVSTTVRRSLAKAQELGLQYVLFTHGSSTSRPFATTARSMVRGFMRSKDATPYIVRRRCIQHYSCFVAAIRPKAGVTLARLACPRCGAADDAVKWQATAGYFQCKLCRVPFTWLDLASGVPESTAAAR